MLKQLRNRKTAKKILWTLAIIIIPPFIFWGAGGLLREKRKADYAGKIFGRKIAFNDYKNSLLAVKVQATLQLGENAEQLMKYLNLAQQAWDRLILLFEADKRGIRVSDKEIVEQIEKMPLFWKNKTFNRAIYEYILRYALKIPARAFEENLRQTLRITKLYEEITAQIKLTEQEVEDEYRRKNEKIKVDYVLFFADDYAQETKPSDKEISEYFEKNKAKFLIPAKINIEYIGLDYPQEASEEDKDKIKEKMQSVKNEIKSAPDFEKIAKSESLNMAETGLFTQGEPIPQLGWTEATAKLCFNLIEKDITPPVETAKGVYILRLKERKQSYSTELNEVKDEINKTLAADKSYSLAKEKAQEIFTKLNETFLKNPKEDLSALAGSLGLTIKETLLFNRTDPIEGIGESLEFTNAAFNRAENTFSGAVEINRNFYIILRVKEFIGIDKEKFAKEEREFKEKLLAQKKEQSFTKFMQELRNKAKLVDSIGQDYETLFYR